MPLPQRFPIPSPVRILGPGSVPSLPPACAHSAEHVQMLSPSGECWTHRPPPTSRLGLHICSKQIGIMRGLFGVDSVVGQGSRFWFAIPLKVQVARVVGKGAPWPAGGDPDRGGEGLEGAS